jgi:hypothetical protein
MIYFHFKIEMIYRFASRLLENPYPFMIYFQGEGTSFAAIEITLLLDRLAQIVAAIVALPPSTFS